MIINHQITSKHVGKKHGWLKLKMVFVYDDCLTAGDRSPD